MGVHFGFWQSPLGHGWDVGDFEFAASTGCVASERAETNGTGGFGWESGTRELARNEVGWFAPDAIFAWFEQVDDGRFFHGRLIPSLFMAILMHWAQARPPSRRW